MQSYFTKPGSAFEPASERSTQYATFERRTAAIHVTPTPNDRYDINTIKDDTRWLSKNAKINEVAALRVVIIEYQARPANQLLGPVSTQDVANMRAAISFGNIQAPNMLPGITLTATHDANEIQADFVKPESRRQRIFQTYLSERCCYAATNDYVFTLMLQETLPTSPATVASNTIRKSLLEAYGMMSKQSPRSPAEIPVRTTHALIEQYICLLPDSIRHAQVNLESMVEDKVLVTEPAKESWIHTFLTEAVHRMTIIFQLLDRSSQSLVSESTAKQWFSLVDNLTFLDQLDSVCFHG